MEDEVRYLYPDFVPSQQLLKGLFFPEWMLVIAPVVVGLFLTGILGVIVGAAISAVLYVLFERNGKRINLFNMLLQAMKFQRTKQLILKKPRSNPVQEDHRIPDESHSEEKVQEKSKKDGGESKPKRRKRSSRKDKKAKQKKTKNMQDYLPFQSIEDGKVFMENGDVFLFLRIHANNLDLMSKSELNKLIKGFSKSLDQQHYSISFYIQDSVFSISQNVLAIEKARALQKVPFLRSILDQFKAYLIQKKSAATKKSFYLRIKLQKKDLDTIDLDDMLSTTIKSFRRSLNLSIAKRQEIMQMMAIYMNKIFADDLPESELVIKNESIKDQLVKKEEKFNTYDIPGIYNFKDMICPVTTSFSPSFGKVGRNITKSYAVASFLGNTDETNLFSKLSNMQGISTMIYVEDLSINHYKNNLKLDLRAKKSSISDEVDAIDVEASKKSLTGSYKRVKNEKQKMYYVSIYFQITAKTQKRFDELETAFLAEVDNISLTLDDLKTMQKEAFFSVSPIGSNKLGKWIKQNIPSSSTANLYPFNEPSLLDETGLPLGTIVDRKVPLIYDPFLFRGGNLNILILGASGQGKTTLMMLLIQNILSMGGYNRNIDFLGMQKLFAEKIGGVNIDVSGSGEFSINPLEVRMIGDVHVGIVSDYISIVRKFMSIYKSKWTERLLDLFEIYLTRAYKLKGIDDSVDITKLRSTDYPLMKDVYDLIEADRLNYDEKKCKGSESDLKDLILGLESAVNGADSKMFNRYTFLGNDNFDDIHMINYDMSRLLNSDLSRKLAQWVNIFLFTLQSVFSNTSRSKKISISIDELHRCLKIEFAPLIDLISDGERTVRQFNSSLIKSTQTIDEVDSNNDELKAKVKPLFSQSTTKFLFHLGDINYQQPKELLSLTDTETERLKEDRYGRCLMRISGQLYDLDVMMPDWFKDVKMDVAE